MSNLHVIRVSSGEIVVYTENETLINNEGFFWANNPYALVNTQNGPALTPMMPWAAQGSDFTVELNSEGIVARFPQEYCETILQAYRQVTSRLDLSATMPANVRSFQPPAR